ncbi:hypothetical protein SS209_03663 [Salmonella enterica subsp. enterica serovar Senftenberg str. SS209]|nr:hypothetical protein SS209_03663 [Salmonella enterica subsp. enterica serovar Senftenberg str. SS209]
MEILYNIFTIFLIR